MPMFEHPSFVQLRQPSVHTTQLASGGAKIDFSAGLVDLVSGLDRSTAKTGPTVRLDSSKPTALNPNAVFVIAAFDETSTSFDHLVGARQESLWDCEAERLNRRQIDDEFEFGRLLDGKVSRFGSFENFVDKIGRMAELVRVV